MTRPPKECQRVKSNFDTRLFSFSVFVISKFHNLQIINNTYFPRKKKKKRSGKSKNGDICLGHFYDVCLNSCCSTKLISIFSTTPLLSKFAPHLIEVFFSEAADSIQEKRVLVQNTPRQHSNPRSSNETSVFCCVILFVS